MADHEISKLMWIAVAVSLAASIYFVARPQINSLADSALGKVDDVAKQIHLPSGNDSTNHGNSNNFPEGFGFNALFAVRPLSDANRWTEKGDYAINGYYVGDHQGHYFIYAKDTSKPISFKSTISEDGGSALANDKLTANNPNIVSVEFMDPIEGLSSSDQFFANDTNLEEIKGLDKFDTSKLTSLNNWFANTPKLKSLDLSSWDVSHVVDFSQMFNGATGLETLNLSGWKFLGLSENAETGQVVEPKSIALGNPFGNNKSLKSINFSNAVFRNTSAWSPSGAFGFFDSLATPALETLNLSGADFTRSQDLSKMFENNNTLTDVNITGVKKAPKQYENGIFGTVDTKTGNMTSGMTNTDLANKLETGLVEK